MTNILDEILPHQKPSTADKAMLKAHEKSQKIIERAVKKANQILTQANFFHKSLKESLRQDLKDAISKSVQTYQMEFRKAIDESIKTNQKILSEYMDSMKKAAEQELKNYTQSRKQQIDQDISLKAEEIVKDTIGEELPASFKEKLIFKALEKAKKNGLFSED